MRARSSPCGSPSTAIRGRSSTMCLGDSIERTARARPICARFASSRRPATPPIARRSRASPSMPRSMRRWGLFKIPTTCWRSASTSIATAIWGRASRGCGWRPIGRSNVWLDRLAPGGMLALATKVGDFHLRRSHARLAQCAGGGAGPHYSRPARRVGASPSRFSWTARPRGSSGVELRPAKVVIGPDVEVSMWATDDNLSGVVKVQAGFDTSGHGKFDDTIEPFELVRDPERTLVHQDSDQAARRGHANADRPRHRSGRQRERLHEGQGPHHHQSRSRQAAAAVRWPNSEGPCSSAPIRCGGVALTVSSDKGPKVPPVIVRLQRPFHVLPTSRRANTSCWPKR